MLRRISMPAPLSGLGKRFCLAIQVPVLSDSVKTGKIGEILVSVGSEVAEDQLILKIDSEKASVDVLAKKSGVITSLPKPDQEVTTGDTIITIKEGPVSVKAVKAPAAAATTAAPAATPAMAAAPKAAVGTEQPSSTVAPAAPRKVVVAGGETRVRQEKITVMRRRIAERLKASQNTAAMLTTFNEIDMTNLIKLRETHKDEFLKRHGVKMGFMSPFAKACATALLEVPAINASWTEDYIEHHDFVDISIAVATKTGLVVPVLRDVQDMTFADIEKKIEDFGTRAKVNKLSIEEMTGGTFTISNGGTFGSWMGTPIINPPQSAILGMHAVKKKPWVNEKGEIVVRDIMAVALTYDHRLIDGRDAVTFLVKVKNLIEDPVRMVLGLP